MIISELVLTKNGIYTVETGGGCRAWRKDLEDGCYYLFTDTSGAYVPDDEDEVLVGLYHEDADDYTDCDEMSFPDFVKRFIKRM